MLIYEAIDSYLFMARCQLEGKGADIGDLVQRAAGGDKQAVGEIFVRYEPELKRVARSRAKQASDADDAVQDVFLKLADSPLLKTFQKKVEQGKKQPRDLIATLKTAVINQLKNIAASQAKHGMTHRSTADVEPTSGSVGAISHAGGKTTHLSKSDKQIVQGVLKRTLAKANLSKKERRFIELLVVGKEGEIKDPPHGALKQVATAIGLKSPKSHKVDLMHAKRLKEKFLKLFCKDKELRDLLPTGHSRETGSSFFRKGLKAVCDDVEMWPVIEFAAAVHGLEEDDSFLSPDAASDLVISWIRSQLTQ